MTRSALRPPHGVIRDDGGCARRKPRSRAGQRREPRTRSIRSGRTEVAACWIPSLLLFEGQEPGQHIALLLAATIRGPRHRCSCGETTARSNLPSCDSMRRRLGRKSYRTLTEQAAFATRLDRCLMESHSASVATHAAVGILLSYCWLTNADGPTAGDDRVFPRSGRYSCPVGGRACAIADRRDK